MSSAFAATTPRGIKRSDERSVERLSLQIVGSPDETDSLLAALSSRLESVLGLAGPPLAPLVLPVLTELLDEATGPPPEGGPTRKLLLTVEEAAKRLRVGFTTTKKYIANGSLKSITIGRRRLVPVAAVDAFVAERSADAEAS